MNSTETSEKTEANSGFSEGWAVPAPHVAPVMLLLLHKPSDKS
jgi:hypothetical protein